MPADGERPRPITFQDTEALLHVVIEVEALLLDDPAPEFVVALGRRLRKSGLIGGEEGLPELRLAVANLNQRLRFALGEYVDAPPADVGLVDHDILFGSQDEARRFVDTIRSLGMRCHQDMPAGTGRVRVVVTTADLVLSPSFDVARKQIEQAALACGGTYDGSRGPGSPEDA